MNSIARILEIEQPKEFKIHAACYNGDDQPLDVFLRDRNEWNNWTAWFNGTHHFKRPYVISLMDFYPERDAWLFGGIYNILNYGQKPHNSQKGSHAYKIKLSEKGADLIGRLKIKSPALKIRNKRLNAESFLSRMELLEILRQPYTGPGFAGYDRASLLWSELVSIVENNRQDWKTALMHMKGVYLITFVDGRNYVGSAYGEIGLWSRWSNYARSRHGGNAEMIKLDLESESTFIEGARFTLIEVWPMRTEDSLILERENYWKDALMSRTTGVNAN